MPTSVKPERNEEKKPAAGTSDDEGWLKGEGCGESVESAPPNKLSGRITFE